MKKKLFIKINSRGTSEHFITRITEKTVCYGLYKPGHENRKATAVMTKKHFLQYLKGFTSKGCFFADKDGKSEYIPPSYCKIIYDGVI